MATTPITPGLTSGSAYESLIQWLGFTAVQAGDAYSTTSSANNSDRTIQVTGNFGAGGSGQLEGSNDGGVTWAILTDPLGNALVFAAAGMKAVTELPQKIRFNVTAGTGININAYLFCKGVHL